MQHPCSHYNAFCSITWLTRMYLCTWQQSIATIIQPLHCDLQPAVQQAHRTTHTWATTRCRTPRGNQKNQNDRNRTRHTHEVPVITACSHFTRKSTRFRAPASSPTPMQHPCSHYNAFCSITWLTRMYLCTWQQSIATIIQPLHCDLQPAVQEAHRTTHTWATTRCRTPRGNQKKSKRSQPHPPHTHEVPVITACSHFTRKSTRFRAPASSPTPMQHPCSHYNAFCSITWLTRMYLCTWQQSIATIIQPLHCDLQPAVQQAHRTTHTWATTRCRTPRGNQKKSKRSQPHPPHTRGTCHHRLQPLYTEKHKVSCSGFLPNPHATSMQPLQCVLQHHVANPHVSVHMATEHCNNHTAITLRSSASGSTSA